MKVRTTVVMKKRNPEFDPLEKGRVEARGERYEVPRIVDIPVGTEIDHPDAWIHACPGDHNTPPRAEPVDDAAKAAVAEYWARRRGQLDYLRAQLRHPPKNAKARAHLQALAASYGIKATDPQGYDPEQDAADKKQPAKANNKAK